jgi:hypothetical protein
MEMPKPSTAHKKLERIVGTWIGDEKMLPSPWDPKGGPAIGRVYNRIAIDGFAVVQDYEQERNGVVTFRGHGVFTWNEPEKCYILYWFDSGGYPPNLFKGTFDKNVLTVTSSNAGGHTRAVFDFNAPNSYKYTMEVSQDAKQWQTFVDATYKLKI